MRKLFHGAINVAIIGYGLLLDGLAVLDALMNGLKWIHGVAIVGAVCSAALLFALVNDLIQEKEVTIVKYPEHERRALVTYKASQIAKFLGWLRERNWFVAEYDAPADRTDGIEMTNGELIAAYFGIDLDAIARERAQMRADGMLSVEDFIGDDWPPRD